MGFAQCKALFKLLTFQIFVEAGTDQGDTLTASAADCISTMGQYSLHEAKLPTSQAPEHLSQQLVRQ